MQVKYSVLTCIQFIDFFCDIFRVWQISVQRSKLLNVYEILFLPVMEADK